MKRNSEGEVEPVNCERGIHLATVYQDDFATVCRHTAAPLQLARNRTVLMYAKSRRMLLQIETRRIEPDITVVEMSGKIALGRDSQRIEALVQDLLRQNEKKVIFDISHVDHMDSTGIGAMAYCFGTLNRCGGELRLAGACGKVLHLLQITRLDHVLPLYTTVEAACVDLTAGLPES